MNMFFTWDNQACKSLDSQLFCDKIVWNVYNASFSAGELSLTHI